MSSDSKSKLSGLSVTQRFATLGVTAFVGFGLVLGIGYYEGEQANSGLDKASELQKISNEINVMRVSSIRLVLAAMDSLVDKGEKKINPERLELISKYAKTLQDGVPKVQELAVDIGNADLVKNYAEDVAVVTKAIQVDLKRLIEAGASDEEFGAIDDAIDGAGDRTTSTLEKLFDDGSAEADKQIQVAQDLSSQAVDVQIGISLAAMALMFMMLRIHGNSILNGIASVRKSMQKILDGDFTTAVEAVKRGDEIGDMARSTDVFRLDAAEKEELERQADENRSLSEQERLAREAQKQADEEAVRFAVGTLGAHLARLSEGDLTAKIQHQFRADLEQVRSDFNTTLERLSSVLSEVRSNAETVQSSGSQMKASADDLAKRTERQASSVEETVTALEQITTTMRTSTERVGAASQLVEGTKKSAQQSGQVVSDAMAAMERIENASAEIGKIINVVEEIAFQTNLLALNAGVEAARAGEAGKGFAVVAQEVRELAGRASGAAKTIKQLVAKSSEEVRTGVELVEAAGEVLRHIGEDVIKINEHVISFSVSAKEQFTGLSEISGAMKEMDNATQQNAAMVEQTMASSQNLVEDADRLKTLVGQFSLSDHGGGYASSMKNSPRPAASASTYAPKSAAHGNAPVASPARALIGKIAGAYKSASSGTTARQTQTSENWEEF